MDPFTVYTGRVAESEPRIEWVSKARCLSTDPDNLFVGGAAQRQATAICRHCPVVAECLAEALDNQVEFGVWGGMTERQRRALLKQHPEVVSWSEFIAAQGKRRDTANRRNQPLEGRAPLADRRRGAARSSSDLKRKTPPRERDTA
jgi:WhiB family transcriptional regulator, redox-sensing transcriptional regulator